jgi:hypothetical protein
MLISYCRQSCRRTWTLQQTKLPFWKERRIYPAGHSITRARCRMNAAFRRHVHVHPNPAAERENLNRRIREVAGFSTRTLNGPLKISFLVGDEACRVIAFGAKTGDVSQISLVSEGQVRDSSRRLLLYQAVRALASELLLLRHFQFQMQVAQLLRLHAAG